MQRGGDEMLDDLDLAWEEQQDPRRRGRPATRQQRRRRKNERKRKGRSFGALFVSLLLLAVLGGGVYWGMGVVQNNQSFKEFVAADYEASEAGAEVDFKVPDGAGGTRIANLLLDQGIVKSRTAFVNACDADNRCKGIQPGVYKLKLKSPAQTVLMILVDPANKLTGTFTITEGLSVIKTLAKLAEQTGIPLADFQAAVKDPAKLGITPDWFVRQDGKPAATTSVEGFLFPDTYAFEPGSSAEDVLKMMVGQFIKVTDEIGFKSKAQGLGLSPYEVLIVASMAQVEAGKVEDFPKVARVAYNRVVKERIDCVCLQFDSTANYWLELNGKPEKHSGDMTPQELDDPANPYNTVSKQGLPIGPISNPGKDALLGAAQPADGTWIYFVAVDKNGTTKFATTFAEHQANIAEACRNDPRLC
jgi:peptidoglycan lytic transglycosylase G